MSTPVQPQAAFFQQSMATSRVAPQSPPHLSGVGSLASLERYDFAG